jgi:hypothetical protein
VSTINIVLGEKYYNKDPQSSDLGRNIIRESISLLDELGYEEFTFKKLAERINSTEASVYRYFDNKFKLLLFLTTWYWAWVEYVIDFKTYHITDPDEKLDEILKVICHLIETPAILDLPGTDINMLRKVVATESDKTYLTKKVDEINNEGLFKGYKGLCHKIAMVVKEINPHYKYPNALVSSAVETIHQQAFFAIHLPSLTEISRDSEQSIDEQVYIYVKDLIKKLI